ncbi:Phosphatidylinositol-binding clathrin assembly protein isoform X2 [Oopsacas minuta]|uniref:Phosphatidylinositol-binding clathrin assembly protein isoform X2 n=1 Tax=Oopsacas minuta TaxID=111878 RepID=A0AAV7JWF5_9METZ|nr:Phosphatidylinositol-binding clathrin assembly protein isoform X2 [Oopsacas minuta]
MAVVIDKIEAAKNTLTGDNLNKAVCKASSHELIAPKRKHVDYLVLCTNEPMVSIPDLATFILERVKLTNWIVSFKALVTAHFLMVQGNERFIQYLAPRTTNFHTDNLSDRSSIDTMNMSTFVRKYARYLNHKATTYQRAGFDYCRVKRGENGFLRTMTIAKLMTHFPILQELFDSLLNFDPQAHEVSNAVIYAAFVRCFQDLVKLFALYNEGIIIMLEHYFDFKKTNAKEGLEIYKKYLNRCENARTYFSVASEVGVEDQSIVDSSASGADLLQAMDTYLASLDGKLSPHGSKSPTSFQTTSPNSNVKRVLSPQPLKTTLSVEKVIPFASSDEALYAKPQKVREESSLLELKDVFNSPAPTKDPWVDTTATNSVGFSTGNPFPTVTTFEPSPFSNTTHSTISEPTLFDTILQPEKLNDPNTATAGQTKQSLGFNVETGLERTLDELSLVNKPSKSRAHVWEEKEVRLTGGDAYSKLPTQISTTQIPAAPPQTSYPTWSSTNPYGPTQNSIF